MRTLIAGGTVVTASDVMSADVLIDGEHVQAIGTGLGPADRTIDATGRLVVPGAVDVHTHFDLHTPFGVSSDDFTTGTAAAAWGGTTTVVDYAGHDYGEPLRAGLDRWRAKAEGKACIDHGFHMMVKEAGDAVLAELAELADAGVTSIKLFMAYPGVYMLDDGDIFRVMSRAAELGLLVVVHAENGGPIDVLVARSVAEQRLSSIHHAMTRPAQLEGEATARAITLAGLAHARLHIAHLSSTPALDAVRAGRDRGADVWAETCPHYLLLTEEELLRPGVEGAKFICSPPLRPASHAADLWAGLATGDLQVVATDHCPFTTAQKAAAGGDFTRTPNGLPGVEDRLTLVYEGVVRGQLDVTRWVDVVATTPAKLFGLYPRKGTIAPGSDADIVVFDPAAERVLSAATHHMNVDYSCYEGRVVRGRPDVVLQRGTVLVENGAFHGRPGAGRFLHRSTAP